MHSPSPLSAANHHLPSPVFLCRILGILFSHIQTGPLLSLLCYIPLRLIRLITSSFCNHVICAFFPSSLLRPSHLSLFCLVSSTLMVCFYKTPKWLLVTADCMTCDTFSPSCSPLTYPVPIISLCRHGNLVCTCKSCHRFSAGEISMKWDTFSHKTVSKRIFSFNQGQPGRHRRESFYYRSMKCTCGIQLQVLLQDLFWEISCSMFSCFKVENLLIAECGTQVVFTFFLTDIIF